MSDFNYWKKQHDSEALKEFNISKEGLLWLKIKSITRRDVIENFIKTNDIQLSSRKLHEQFIELFDLLKKDIHTSHNILNTFIYHENTKRFNSLDINSLVSELYKVETFKWGGDNQNDLGKYLIKKYIKGNRSYDFLINNVDNGIMKTVQDYLVCSWYNHWSTILIEHLFKSHKKVLPTVGQIKNVDFFINEIPFDLKVTYLPINFIEKQRKLSQLKPELTFLKSISRDLKINFNNNYTNLYYSLSERLKDNGSEKAISALKDIKDFRLFLIKQAKQNPKVIAKNLYENQSEFRFGAENRLFLILVDKDNFNDSWKLRRNMDLLRPKINTYLNSFGKKSIDDLKISFYKEGNPKKYPNPYEVLTDVLVIEKS